MEQAALATEVASKAMEQSAKEFEQTSLIFQADTPTMIAEIEAAAHEYRELGHTLNVMTAGFRGKNPVKDWSQLSMKRVAKDVSALTHVSHHQPWTAHSMLLPGQWACIVGTCEAAKQGGMQVARTPCATLCLSAVTRTLLVSVLPLVFTSQFAMLHTALLNVVTALPICVGTVFHLSLLQALNPAMVWAQTAWDWHPWDWHPWDWHLNRHLLLGLKQIQISFW